MEISNAHVLITGGTGSFGHRVALRALALAPRKVTILSRDEKKQYEMRRLFPDFSYVVGDVRDATAVAAAFSGVDIVFHAAALKQVPSCERWPLEAVKTNVLGTENVCSAAVAMGVQVVVALSTDKAVEPVNAMGMTKAVMEKLVSSHAAAAKLHTVFCCVRYGNVMGSRGSVIPLFRQQLDRGEPLTLTIPEMTRFMLTLDDAVSLVLFAMENAKGGEIFVKKAPACTVDFLADTMLRKYASGKGAKHCLGMRAGEKIHEVLINEYEMIRARDRGDFFEIVPDVDGTVRSVPVAPVPYTSKNARQIADYEELSMLLDNSDLEPGSTI